MNLANFNIKDFFISNNLLICENYNNILTTTKIILIYQIIFLFVMTLNNIWTDYQKPLLLNKAPLVKQK